MTKETSCESRLFFTHMPLCWRKDKTEKLIKSVITKQVRVLHVGQQQGQFADGKADNGVQQPFC